MNKNKKIVHIPTLAGNHLEVNFENREVSLVNGLHFIKKPSIRDRKVVATIATVAPETSAILNDFALPDAMVVEGAGTALANTIYMREGDSEGKARFSVVGSPVNEDSILWDGDKFVLFRDTIDLYESYSDVATPDLATGWVGSTGQNPAPTFRRATWADIDTAEIDRASVPIYLKTFHQRIGILSASATLDFPSIAANSQEQLAVSVAGAAVGDTVQLAPPAAIAASLIWSGFVSSASTVTIRLLNISGSAIDPASASWGVSVIKAP